MLTTPPVKTLPDNCVDQYKNVNSVLNTPIFPTPTPSLDEVQRQEKENWEKWNNRWAERTPELLAEGTKRGLLWPQLPEEWADILRNYYKLVQEAQMDATRYTPGEHDSDKIQNTVDILERLKRSKNSAISVNEIDKIIHQLNTDLMYFRIKHGK